MTASDEITYSIDSLGFTINFPKPREVTKKGLRFERWRVSMWYRRYKGLGHPRFEFEFRLGFVRR